VSPAFLHILPDSKLGGFTRRAFDAAFPGGNRYRVYARGGRATASAGPAADFVDAGYWTSRGFADDLASASR
jgi:hypothetical protein